jgi:hypothetical protein
VYASFDHDDVAADYRVLLRRGSVTRKLALAQHDAWRRAISEEAENDGFPIRTWSQAGSPAAVWAVLPDWRLTFEERAALEQRRSWLQED